MHIRLSDGSSFIAHAEVVLHHGVRADMELSPAEIEEVTKSSQIVFARQSALSFLSRSAHTRKSLARKLKSKGFDRDSVERAIARVAELGYLDDRAFAETWTRARLASRLEGYKALYRGLVQRGVSRDVADDVLVSLYSDELELSKARELVLGLPARKAASRLTARGFRSRTIARVLRGLGKDPEDAAE